MPISPKERLLNRLISCIRLDKADPTQLHIEIDSISKYLHEFGIPVPPLQFEEVVQAIMDKHVKGQVQLGQPHVMAVLAEAILQLALDFILYAEETTRKNHNSQPDVPEGFIIDGK